MSIPTCDPGLEDHIKSFNPQIKSWENEALSIFANQKIKTLIKIVKTKKKK